MGRVNWKLLAAGAVALFLTGYAAGSCGKPTSAELNAAEDARKEAVVRAEHAESAREAVEIQSRAEIEQARTTADSAVALADSAARRRPTVIDRIVEREAPRDTALARRVAEAVRDSLVVHEIRPLLAATIAQDSAFAAQGRLLAAEREARLATQEALQAALVEIGALRADRPSWVGRHWKDALVIAAAYGGWKARDLLATRALAGPTR